MEIPWACRCGEENWIDLENLFEWPLDRLLTAQGFVCTRCGMREAISYTTPSLREAERKLTHYKPGTPKFAWYFGRLAKKQTGVNARGETYGTREHQNVAIP